MLLNLIVNAADAMGALPEAERVMTIDTSLEAGRIFHDLLLSRDTLLVEFPSNGAALTKPDFFVFAVPLNIRGIDSSGCRLFAVVEK